MKNSWVGFITVIIVGFAHHVAGQETDTPFAVVGPHKTLIYFERSYSEGSVLPAPHLIYKSDGAGKKFRRIGETRFPENARALERQLERRALTHAVFGHLGVNSSDAAYRILLEHGTDTLGLLLLDPDLSATLGLLFVDEYRATSEDATYRIDQLDKGNNVVRSVTIRPTPGAMWESGTLTVDSREARDSSVSIAWRAKGIYNPHQIPLVATVYERRGHTGEFAPQQTLLMLSDAESGEGRVYYTDDAEPGQHVAYYAVLEDLAGNVGRLSDTVSMLPYNLSSLQHLSNLAVTDTSQGLLLTWDALPADAIYGAIEIQKSRQLGSGYVVVDTVPANGISYLDRRVIPSTAYYYRLRPLVYELSSRMPTINYSEAVGYRSGTNEEPPLAPARLAVDTHTEGVKVTWAHGSELNLFGYYVMRGPSRQSMSVISPVIKDTVFIDSLIPRYFTGQMHYAIQSMDMAQQLSDTSAVASIFIRQPVLLIAPSGIHAARVSDGVALEWEDAARRDEKIYGYHLYRKPVGETYYERLNDNALKAVYYTDRSAVGSMAYEYAVTSTDVWGNESILSATSRVGTDERATATNPPSDITLRNLSAGIEVSWPIPVDVAPGTSYVIYRKALSDVSFEAIATVDPAANYVDDAVKPGVRYQYAVGIKSEEGERQPASSNMVKRK